MTHSVDVTAATIYEAVAQSVWSHPRLVSLCLAAPTRGAECSDGIADFLGVSF